MTYNVSSGTLSLYTTYTLILIVNSKNKKINNKKLSIITQARKLFHSNSCHNN